jgi:hypothetical protein
VVSAVRHASCSDRGSAKKLTLNQTPVITVTDKAFFDVGHSLKDQRAEPQKPSSGLRCLGNSSGDETNSPVIRVYDAAGNVIERQEHAGDFKE